MVWGVGSMKNHGNKKSKLDSVFNSSKLLQVHTGDQSVLPTPRHSFVALSLPRSAQCPCWTKGTLEAEPLGTGVYTHTRSMLTSPGHSTCSVLHQFITVARRLQVEPEESGACTGADEKCGRFVRNSRHGRTVRAHHPF